LHPGKAEKRYWGEAQFLRWPSPQEGLWLGDLG
jgi:hypothetical protein